MQNILLAFLLLKGTYVEDDAYKIYQGIMTNVITSCLLHLISV